MHVVFLLCEKPIALFSHGCVVRLHCGIGRYIDKNGFTEKHLLGLFNKKLGLIARSLGFHQYADYPHTINIETFFKACPAELQELINAIMYVIDEDIFFEEVPTVNSLLALLNSYLQEFKST